jgi:hypothetical protein
MHNHLVSDLHYPQPEFQIAVANFDLFVLGHFIYVLVIQINHSPEILEITCDSDNTFHSTTTRVSCEAYADQNIIVAHT